MDQTTRKPMTLFTRAARMKRMLERLRAGAGYDDVARDEGISERRVRQIVATHLKRRAAVEDGAHANLQLDRLGFAMRVASEALAKGDVRAVAPFIKVIDRLDRYQAIAREAAPRRRTAADEVVVRQLVARIRAAYDDELAARAKTAAVPCAAPVEIPAVVPSPAGETEAAAPPAPAPEPPSPWRPAPVAAVDFMSGLRR